MKLLLDAHLPRRLALLLQRLGHDALHTLDLLEGNRTSDEAISQIVINEDRIVVTKDSDFVDSFLLVRRPPRLLLVSNGNISNCELERLFLDNIDEIAVGFTIHDDMELSRKHIIVHE